MQVVSDQRETGKVANQTFDSLHPREVSEEYHPRQWVDRSGAAYRGRPLACVPEYHPRQWVDRSSPAYRGYRDPRSSLLFPSRRQLER